MEEEARLIIKRAVSGVAGASLWELSRKLFDSPNGVELSLPGRGADRAAPDFSVMARQRNDHPRYQCGFRVEIFMNALTILPLDEPAAREAGRMRAIRQAKGLASQPSDMPIAGIAIAMGGVLATRNIRDFEGLPLQLIDPWRWH